MPFIGNTPDVNFTSFAKQDLTGVTGSPAKRGYTLSHAVANANEIEVFVNNVRQEPTESYTVNGTGLTMTGDVETTDDFYIIYLGKAIQTTVPPDGSVSTAKIASSAVDLTSKVTGVLPVANGGTGVSSGFSYSEGTWTPTLKGVGTEGSPTYTVRVGHYTRIGNTVNIVGALQITSLGGATSHLQIHGLPFASKNSPNYRPSIYCGYGAGLALTAGASVGGWIPENSSYIRITYWSSTAGTSYGNQNSFSADGAIYFACTYQTDE